MRHHLPVTGGFTKCRRCCCCCARAKAALSDAGHIAIISNVPLTANAAVAAAALPMGKAPLLLPELYLTSIGFSGWGSLPLLLSLLTCK